MYFLNVDYVMVNDNKKLIERFILQIYKELIRKGKLIDKVFKQLRDVFIKECIDGFKKLIELKFQ